MCSYKFMEVIVVNAIHHSFAYSVECFCLCMQLLFMCTFEQKRVVAGAVHAMLTITKSLSNGQMVLCIKFGLVKFHLNPTHIIYTSSKQTSTFLLACWFYHTYN